MTFQKEKDYSDKYNAALIVIQNDILNTAKLPLIDNETIASKNVKYERIKKSEKFDKIIKEYINRK